VRLPAQHPWPLAGQAIAAVMGCTRGQPITVQVQAAGLTEPATSKPDGDQGAALPEGDMLTNWAAVAGVPRC
jgi:hypothetical protein